MFYYYLLLVLLFINLLIYVYFWLHWVFFAAHRLSLVAASKGLLSIEVRGLLIVAASIVAEHGLQARELQ